FSVAHAPFVLSHNNRYLISSLSFRFCGNISFELDFSATLEVFQRERTNIVGQQKEEVKFLKFLAPPLMAAVVALSPISSPPVSLGQTIDVQKGATLFRRTCIGCHDAGGNIIQPVSLLNHFSISK
ncbi:hypothetical protein RD792_002263, partial [Penstemon davidsonii]